MTEEEINPNEEMILAFARWRTAQENVRNLTNAKDEYIVQADKRIQEMALLEIDARLAVEKLMKACGVTEDILPGSQCDYKVRFRTMPEKVKIVDESAVPPKFIKEETKKSIKKKELLDDLKKKRDTKQAMPNYAVIERDEPQLEWELIKKSC